MNAEENKVSNRLQAVQDHSRLFGEYLYVYPVISRRARGLSIGINLNPDKRCNFDCIYCEVDRRTPGRSLAVEPERLRQELDRMVRWVKQGQLAQLPKFAEAPALTETIKDFAFSGDGEPTMVTHFAECVEAVVAVKQLHGLNATKIVLITDAAGLDKADVRRGLALLDQNQGEIWGKLDAGTEDYYREVNRSHVRFERILKNLTATSQQRPIVIQSLFLKVHGRPMPEAELQAYLERLHAILRAGGRIRLVQAYTIARPTPESYATKLEPEELERIAQRIRSATGLAVESFS